MNLYESFGKRVFDLISALIGFFILSPLLVLISILIKIDSKGPVFFLQERIGKDGNAFKLIKFRSMYVDPIQERKGFTPGDTRRITRFGKLIRKTKVDELPELINVIKGEMSLVGPRPEVRKYVELFKKDFDEILKIKPGITDYATLEFRDEEEILRGVKDKEGEYIKNILPLKIKLYKKYTKSIKFKEDLRIILKTLLRIVYL